MNQESTIINEKGKDEVCELTEFDPIVIESQEQYNNEILSKAREIAKEMVCKKKKLKARRKKRVLLRIKKMVMLIIFLCIFVILFYHQYPVPRYSRKTNTIYRNLDYAEGLIETLPKARPIMAWHEDLPYFIRKDLKMLEKGWNLEYRYAGNTIEIDRTTNDGEEFYFRMYVYGSDNQAYAYGFHDASIYIDDNVLYWYCWIGETFKLIKISDDFIQQKVLSNYAKDTPIYMGDGDSWKIGNHILLKRGNELSLWTSGICRDTLTEDIGNILYIHDEYAMLETSDNKIYEIDIYKDRDNDWIPKIHLSYICDGVEISKYGNSTNELYFEFPKQVKYEFPIVKKNDESYVILPEDINSYVSYSMANKGNEILYEDENRNMKRQLVKMSDLEFVSAYIYYGYSETAWSESFGWLANINFEYNGTIYHYDGCPIYGYDRSYSLTDAEKERLTTTVYSAEDYWQAVEAIRETYQNYYERQGG